MAEVSTHPTSGPPRDPAQPPRPVLRVADSNLSVVQHSGGNRLGLYPSPGRSDLNHGTRECRLLMLMSAVVGLYEQPGIWRLAMRVSQPYGLVAWLFAV
jgi:hypothetical protein